MVRWDQGRAFEQNSNVQSSRCPHLKTPHLQWSMLVLHHAVGHFWPAGTWHLGTMEWDCIVPKYRETLQVNLSQCWKTQALRSVPRCNLGEWEDGVCMLIKICPLFPFKNICSIQQCDTKITRFAFPEKKITLLARHKFNSTSEVLWHYDIQHAHAMNKTHVLQFQMAKCKKESQFQLIMQILHDYSFLLFN